MFDVSRILAIPEDNPDHVQCGISAANHRALVQDRGGIKLDGTKAKASLLKKDFSKSYEKAGFIKGDKKLSESSPSNRGLAVTDKKGFQSESVAAQKIKAAIARSKADKPEKMTAWQKEYSDKYKAIKSDQKPTQAIVRTYSVSNGDGKGSAVEITFDRDFASDKKLKPILTAYAKDSLLGQVVEHPAPNVLRIRNPDTEVLNKDGKHQYVAKSLAKLGMSVKSDQLIGDKASPVVSTTSATPKSRKVVKGMSPRDRGVEPVASSLIKKAKNEQEFLTLVDRAKAQSEKAVKSSTKNISSAVKKAIADMPKSFASSEEKNAYREKISDLIKSEVDKGINDHFKFSPYKSKVELKDAPQDFLESLNTKDLQRWSTRKVRQISTAGQKASQDFYKAYGAIPVEKQSKPKQPSPTAKKLNMTAEQEARALKNIKRF